MGRVQIKDQDSGMSRLEINVGKRVPKGLESGEALWLEIVIDDEVIGEGLVVDIRELYRTLKYTCEMWLFTGIEGEPMFAGISEFFVANRSGKTVRWEWFSPIVLGPGDSMDQRVLREAEFDADVYDETVRRCWWSACTLLRTTPMLSVVPTDCGREGVFGLNDWLASGDAAPEDDEFLTRTFKNL